MLAAALVAASSASAAAGFEVFRTPSRNIICLYIRSTADSRPALRCAILSGIVPRPARPPGCPLDFGGDVAMAATGRSSIACVGDTIAGEAGGILAYGKTWRRGGFVCVSRSTGLRCTNASGHGFVLSRARSTLF